MDQEPQNESALTIDDMKKMTMLTGELVAWQQEHLKMWPKMLFDELTTYTINFDFGLGIIKNPEQADNDGSIGKIHYDFNFKPGFRLTKTKKDKLAVLHLWIKNLFWEEVDFKVFSNDKIIYQTKKK
jgi:hypothetical protein